MKKKNKWNKEELDHYKSMYEYLEELAQDSDIVSLDWITEIASFSADLLRYKREFDKH